MAPVTLDRQHFAGAGLGYRLDRPDEPFVRGIDAVFTCNREELLGAGIEGFVYGMADAGDGGFRSRNEATISPATFSSTTSSVCQRAAAAH